MSISDNRPDYRQVNPYVRGLAARMCGSNNDLFEELEQEGTIEAWRSACAYRPGKVYFLTYAKTRIRGAMLRFIRDKYSLIRVPAWAYEQGIRSACGSLEEVNPFQSTRDFAPTLIDALSEERYEH